MAVNQVICSTKVGNGVTQLPLSSQYLALMGPITLVWTTLIARAYDISNHGSNNYNYIFVIITSVCVGVAVVGEYRQ